MRRLARRQIDARGLPAGGIAQGDHRRAARGVVQVARSSPCEPPARTSALAGGGPANHAQRARRAAAASPSISRPASTYPTRPPANATPASPSGAFVRGCVHRREVRERAQSGERAAWARDPTPPPASRPAGRSDRAPLPAREGRAPGGTDGTGIGAAGVGTGGGASGGVGVWKHRDDHDDRADHAARDHRQQQTTPAARIGIERAWRDEARRRRAMVRRPARRVRERVVRFLEPHERGGVAGVRRVGMQPPCLPAECRLQLRWRTVRRHAEPGVVAERVRGHRPL